jgi:anthranilate synthase component 1
MSILPVFADFAAKYEAGEAQVLYARLVADLETPVSAYLKLAEGRQNTILLESVQGGETRGRYSIVGLKPDLIWRYWNGKAEINRSARANPDAFVPDAETNPLKSLRALLKETKLTLPDGVPPMAVGLYGYLGYDMVRLIEKLPNVPPDTLGLPDAILMRPSIVAGVAGGRSRCPRGLRPHRRAHQRYRRRPGTAAAAKPGAGGDAGWADPIQHDP